MKEIFKNNENFLEGTFIKVYSLSHGDKRWPLFEHAHEYMQIWYIAYGACTHIVEGGSYKMKKGSVLIIPPNAIHQVFEASSDCQIIGCDFSEEIVDNLNIVGAADKYSLLKFAYEETFEAAIRKVRPQHKLGANCEKQVETTLRLMLETYLKKDIYFQYEMQSYLLKLLVDITRDYERRIPDDSENITSYTDDINRAVEYIKNNYSERLYIKEVAQVSTMSISYFSYFFKKITGMTFVAYTNKVRIEHAKRLLKETNMSLSLISEVTGHSDMANFSRKFKKYVGETPGIYRDKNK